MPKQPTPSGLARSTNMHFHTHLTKFVTSNTQSLRTMSLQVFVIERLTGVQRLVEPSV
jgi:hypothetical protein